MFSHLPFLQYEGSWHSFTSAKGTTDTGYSRNICSGASYKSAGGGHNNNATSRHSALLVKLVILSECPGCLKSSLNLLKSSPDTNF